MDEIRKTSKEECAFWWANPKKWTKIHKANNEYDGTVEEFFFRLGVHWERHRRNLEKVGRKPTKASWSRVRNKVK